MSDRPESIPVDPFPDREPAFRRTWLRRFSRARDRETLERFEYLLHQLTGEAAVLWRGRHPLPELLRAAMDDAGSLAVFLAELPASDHPLRRRAHAWSLQLASLVRAMDASLGGAEPDPGPERTPRADPPEVLEDAVALLTQAGRLAGRVPPVEAALRSGDRELFVWASLAEAIRHDLHGDGIGGTEEEPAPDSTLGKVRSMKAWPRETWDRMFDNERADLEADG